ncbi:MAG: hypothetical protein AAF682_29890 [Planctomycetota bacterium]
MKLPFAFLALAAGADAQITSQERAVSTFAQTYHQPTDLADTQQDGQSSLLPGPFFVELETTAVAFFNSSQTFARQSSDVDVEAGSFTAAGHAAGSLYVQGTGIATAESAVDLRFTVDGAARFVFEEIGLSVDDVFQSLFSFDRPGDASVSIELTAEPSGEVLFSAALILDDVGTKETFDLDDELVLPVGAGSYRLLLTAASNDETDGVEQIEASLGAATYDVTGALELTLQRDVAALSLSAGGAQALTLAAGADFAGKLYGLVGSASGTSPGFPLGGFVLPLNPDPYFNVTLANPAGSPLANAFGVLDAAGGAAASFGLPAGSNPALAGATVAHAFAVVDPLGFAVELVSNSAAVELLP